MNARRAALVHQAFAILDTDKSGFVDVDDIVDKYDASRHPDVISGKATADDVYRDFLDVFEVGGDRDGKVSKREFDEYYATVSATIDDDDYFELMIRTYSPSMNPRRVICAGNAWHIAGGQGKAANSANTRVLVTRADGSQAVECIDDDLGLDTTDAHQVLARLQRQGVDAVSVKVYGAPVKPKPTASDTYRTTFKLE